MATATAITKWHVRLGGTDEVLSKLPQFFQSSKARVFAEYDADAGDQYYLDSKTLRGKDGSHIQQRAERLIHAINYFAYFYLGTAERVSLRMLHPIASNGARGNEILLQTGRIWQTFEPSGAAAEALIRALKDPFKDAALAFLISGPDDFRNLYAALETVQAGCAGWLKAKQPKTYQRLRRTARKDDPVKIGATYMSQKKWLSTGEQKRIKKAAHSYKVLGAGARHGLKNLKERKPRKSISVGVARSYVEQVVSRFLFDLT